MSASAVTSSRRTPLNNTTSPRVASSRASTPTASSSSRIFPPPPPPKVPLLVLSSNQPGMHRSPPVPLKAPTLSQIFAAPPSAKKAVSAVRTTQAHSNPFQSDRQFATQSLGLRTYAPAVRRPEPVESRRSYVAKTTDPLLSRPAPVVEQRVIEPKRALLAPYAIKGSIAPPASPSLRKRANSAPTGTRSVLNPQSLPETCHAGTLVKDKKPSLTGVFVAEKNKRPLVNAASAPFARDTPRSVTPKPMSTRTEGPRAPFSTNTPRAATPPPSRAASRPPYSIGNTPRKASTPVHKVRAPYAGLTPRPAAQASSYRAVAPYA